MDVSEHIRIALPQLAELDAEIDRLRDENYTDLLDQMDEAWGHGEFTVGSAEIRAFLESRIVHQPTTRLRAQVESLRGEVDKHCERWTRALELVRAKAIAWECEPAAASALGDLLTEMEQL